MTEGRATPASVAEVEKLEAELDPEMRFRPLLAAAGWIVAGLLFALSMFHYYTAGFGLLPEERHRGIHLAFVLGLVFLVFSFRASRNTETPRAGVLRPLGVPILDWLCLAGAVAAALYYPAVFHDLQFRVGATAAVTVYTTPDHWLNPLAEFWQRVVAWFDYLY